MCRRVGESPRIRLNIWSEMYDSRMIRILQHQPQDVKFPYKVSHLQDNQNVPLKRFRPKMLPTNYSTPPQRHNVAAPPIRTTDDKSKGPAECVRIVLPSERAKLGVLSLPFYEDVFSSSSRTRPGFLSIENAPIVQHRAMIRGRPLTKWVSFEDSVSPCGQGNVLQFLCIANQNPMQSQVDVQSCWSRSTHLSVDGILHKS